MKKSDEPASLEKLKASSLRMLSRRDHSLGELRDKLKTRYHFLPETFSALTEYLKKYNYLIDEKILAQRWSEAWRGEGRGQFWIQGKLKSKKLPTEGLRDDAQENELQELEAARAYLLRKLKTRTLNVEKPTFEEKSKLTRKLTSRGFSHDVAFRVIKELETGVKE